MFAFPQGNEDSRKEGVKKIYFCLKEETKTDNKCIRKFVVYIDSNYVRDAQVCRDPEKYDDEEAWSDAFPNIFVGIFTANNKKEAIKIASEESGYCKALLIAEEV